MCPVPAIAAVPFNSPSRSSCDQNTHLLGQDFEDLTGNRLDEDGSVLVSDGDTVCEGDLDISNEHERWVLGEPWEPTHLWRHGLIIVDGASRCAGLI